MMAEGNFSILFILLLSVSLFVFEGSCMKAGERSFEIDYSTDQFRKDGQPFHYISGSIHYFRVHPTDWRDRLRKMRMAGFNAVQTYVEWASHEPEPGMYDFTGMFDLETFIKTAQEEDLSVILRLGPFIDAERDMGGLPYWLLHMNPEMRLRTSDPTYLQYVDRWFTSVLLPKVKPLLYENGGPIIMLQVENEYGSYPSCDFSYTGHMRDLVRNGVGLNAVLFTTDGDGVGFLKCGKIPEVYSTVDFGSGTDVNKAFDAMRLFEPHGPLVNSEYYPGWLDHWSSPHSTVDAQAVAKTLDEMLAMNASVNMYMFHGGTSFGLTAGSNKYSNFQVCPTSYDYDAPLSEAGDPTEKYWILRNITKKYLPLPSGDVPPPSTKESYGKVQMASLGTVNQLSTKLASVWNKWPLTFEALRVANGLVVYQTSIPFRTADPAPLAINDVHDRGYVYLDGVYVGTVDRQQELYTLPISARINASLAIIVESQGRICFGADINDFKGLTTNVTVSGHQLEGWTIIPLPLTNNSRLAASLTHMPLFSSQDAFSEGRMSFFQGTFNVSTEGSQPHDTFLRLDGWSKGLAWVNGFLLGRYWPEVGPQVTLYVPHGVLNQGTNTLMLLEYEAAPCLTPDTCYVTFTDTHVINGPTPL
ncbi:hypothetical protein Pmani_029407 [Petrolisthes manimaculis]|uniref:Beta-galactosidase n=1 Tax=Petrolisthes manimaculis TaxID=1843537 RepID=A0AAE1P025_9EUCA|nr:hypothetical protein Pmani_029407 [Petrolisthes manimaculis]